MPNERQRERWNAEDEVANWPKHERITATLTPSLLRALALAPGERVVDIGCGGGLAAIEAARAVGPSGAVTGFDLSAGFVRMATERAAAADAGNVRFDHGDAQVDEIPGAPFDAAMSQFGVMFFEDPVAAFSNIRRQLRAGGRLAFGCWQSLERNPWFPHPVLAKFASAPSVPPAGGPPAPGPFAFADREYVREVLTRAGFGEIGHRELAEESVVPEDSVYERYLLDSIGVDPARRDEAWEEVEKLVEPRRVGDGNVRLELATQIFTARVA